MAEKAPESKLSKGKGDTRERRKSSVQIVLSPEDETGYGSATHSSDLLSGAEATSESAAFTSEDFGSEGVKVKEESPSIFKKLQRRIRSPKKPERGSESDTKAEKTPVKTPDKMKTRSQKKSTPVKQTKEVTKGREDTLIASQSHELVTTECGISPAEKEVSEGVTPKKSRPGRWSLSKFMSPKKDKAASHLTVPRTIETRSSKKMSQSPSKSSVSSSRSPRKQKASTSSVLSTEGSLTEQPEESGNKDKSIKSSASPAKRRSPWKIGKTKSPGKQQKASTPSESSGAEAPALSSDKSETRRKLKFSHGRTKSAMKQEVTDTLLHLQTSSGEERPHSGMKQSILATYELMSSGVQSIQMSRKGSDCIPLLRPEDRGDTTDSDDTRETAVSKPEDKCLEEENLFESATERRRRIWRPANPIQKGGFMHEDLRTSFKSSIDDTTTEMSTVSDSSAIHGGSESKKGYSTSSDTQSEISVFEEVPELVSSVLSLETAGKSETPVFEEETVAGASGVQRAEKPQLRRQKRIKEKSSSDSDEEARSFRAICGSPSKKPAPQKETSDYDDD